MRELSQGAGRDTPLRPLTITTSTPPRSLPAPPHPRHYPPQLMCQQGNYSSVGFMSFNIAKPKNYSKYCIFICICHSY